MRRISSHIISLCSVLLILLFVLVLPVSCGSATTLGYESAVGDDNNGGDDNGSDDGGTVHPSQVSVAYLRSLATDVSVTLDRPYSIHGRVTATDAYGEYYKTICVEDATGGVEVLIDGFALYTRYALYDEVHIECHGLALGRYGSRIELGAPPTGEYAVDRIPESDADRYITVFKDIDDSFTAADISVGELRPEHVGRTVRIAGLHAVGEGLSWCDFDFAAGVYADTERAVADDAGTALTVCVRGECRYAAEPIPDGRFTLNGIVEYRSGSYALRITNHGIFQQHD